jgi:2-C-methyl-D-erythritol 4-phosphate cytidylyltransferase
VPKQWQSIAGKLVVDWSIDAFKNHSLIDFVIVVLPKNKTLHRNDVATCTGGNSRSLSVYNGLIAAKNLSPDKVLIHDVARPAVSEDIITDIILEVNEETGAAPGLPISDALWKISDGEVTKTLNRDFIFRAQTPQGFPFSKILEAHENHTEKQAFDDVELAKKIGLRIILKTGHKDNMKITTPEDFLKISKILVRKAGYKIIKRVLG